MKQIFAIFFALCVLPCFHSYAWVGGPFSNNSYFGENGDDGVYEAVATPTSAINGVGIYRWAVANAVNGVTDADVISTSSIQTTTNPVTGAVTTTSFVNILPVTSNIYFGGLNRISHTWFLQGVVYTGFCQGNASSGLGVVSVSGNASFGSGNVASGFTGPFGPGTSSGDGIPVSRFSATGSAALTDTTTPANNINFNINVFGSKISSQVIYNGVTGT